MALEILANNSYCLSYYYYLYYMLFVCVAWIDNIWNIQLCSFASETQSFSSKSLNPHIKEKDELEKAEEYEAITTRFCNFKAKAANNVMSLSLLTSGFPLLYTFFSMGSEYTGSEGGLTAMLTLRAVKRRHEKIAKSITEITWLNYLLCFPVRCTAWGNWFRDNINYHIAH